MQRSGRKLAVELGARTAHNLTHGDAVTITIPWVAIEVARALAVLVTAGAIAGAVIVAVRGGRHG